MIDIPVGVRNIIGDKIKMLTVEGFGGMDNIGNRWICRCDCGTLKVFAESSLFASQTESCGCSNITEHPLYHRFHAVSLGSYTLFEDACQAREKAEIENYGFTKL